MTLTVRWGRCQFGVGICQISTSVPGWWQISYLLHRSRGLVLWLPIQWNAAEKDRIGESASLPNNSIPPAGPSWLPSYLWQPTKLVRVISGYPDWRLSWQEGGARLERLVWGQRLGLAVVSWLSCRALVSMSLLGLSPRIDAKTHWSHLIYFCVARGKPSLERNFSAEVLEVEVVKVVLEGVDS